MPSSTYARARRALALAVALLIGLVLSVAGASPAAAADASMSIQKAASVSDVTPGQTFEYTIQVQCTTSAVSGCTNATVTDPLPDHIELNGDIVVPHSPAPTIDTDPPFRIAFNDDLGGGDVGLKSGEVVTITVPVKVSGDIPVSESGTGANTLAWLRIASLLLLSGLVLVLVANRARRRTLLR